MTQQKEVRAEDDYTVFRFSVLEDGPKSADLPFFKAIPKPSPLHFPEYSKIVMADGNLYSVRGFIKIGPNESDFVLVVSKYLWLVEYITICPRQDKIIQVKRHGFEALVDKTLKASHGSHQDLMRWHEQVANSIETNYQIKTKPYKVYVHELDQIYDNNFFMSVITQLKKQDVANFSYVKMLQLLVKQTWVKEIKVYDKFFVRFVTFFEIDKKKAKKFIKANFNRFLISKKDTAKVFAQF